MLLVEVEVACELVYDPKIWWPLTWVKKHGAYIEILSRLIASRKHNFEDHRINYSYRIKFDQVKNIRILLMTEIIHGFM